MVGVRYLARSIYTSNPHTSFCHHNLVKSILSRQTDKRSFGLSYLARLSLFLISLVKKRTTKEEPGNRQDSDVRGP